jgi:hypothetical protein
LKIIFLFIFASCQYIEVIKSKFNSKSDLTETPVVYAPQSPAFEQDAIIQQSPKIKLLRVLEQFTESPDHTFKKIVVEEFKKNPGIFTAQGDNELKAGLNRLIPLVLQANELSIELLMDLKQILIAKNQEHVKNILAQAFNTNSLIIIKKLVKSDEDRNCSLIHLLPNGLSPEEHRAIVESRVTVLQKDKEFVTDEIISNYFERCLQNLRSKLRELPPAPSFEI